MRLGLHVTLWLQSIPHGLRQLRRNSFLGLPAWENQKLIINLIPKKWCNRNAHFFFPWLKWRPRWQVQVCLQCKNTCKLGEIRGSFTVSVDCNHCVLLNTHHSGFVSKIWHDVALRGKIFMLGFFDPDVESSVQEPSLAAAKGWASSNTST